MADQNQTQIAQQLTRIENAKNELAKKGYHMGLEWYDPEEGIATLRPIDFDTFTNTTTDRLDQIAVAFERIEERTAEHISVDGPTVTPAVGYYKEECSVSVKTVEKATPAISVNATTGAVIATVPQEEGYVSGDNKSDSINLSDIKNADQTTVLNPEHIKVGTAMFGVGGTFTGDGTIHNKMYDDTDDKGNAHKYTTELTVGESAYSNGYKILGALPKMEATIVEFDPETEEEKTVISFPTRVEGMTMKLPDSFLDRLSAI